MLKTSKLVSLLLVVAMLMSVLTVGIVSTSAEAVETVTIVYDGQTVNAHVGDTIRYWGLVASAFCQALRGLGFALVA